MGMTEIVLLILGMIIFAVSFILPEKKARLSEQDVKLGEKQIKELVAAQLQEVKTQVSDAADETITYAVEKTERSLERVTNEKIMAVNEYSDTVLEAIHKNHEEVLFLYDMLNDKHDKLTSTAVEVEKKSKETLQRVKDAEAAAETALAEPALADSAAVVSEKKKPAGKRSAGKKAANGKSAEKNLFMEKGLAENTVTTDSVTENRMSASTAATETEKPFTLLQPQQISEKAVNEKAMNDKRLSVPEAVGVELPRLDLSFADAGEDGKNNNEKILALHKAGRSNIAIAKELGLGIGEVKLVLDLFKGV